MKSSRQIYSLRTLLLLLNIFLWWAEQHGCFPVSTISIPHDISIKNYTITLCDRDYHISHLFTQLSKNNKIHSWECGHKRMSTAPISILVMAHMGKQANFSYITCQFSIAFTKQICLKTAVKGLYIWIIHKQLLTQQGPTAQAETMMPNSLSRFVSMISTDMLQHITTVGL